MTDKAPNDWLTWGVLWLAYCAEEGGYERKWLRKKFRGRPGRARAVLEDPDLLRRYPVFERVIRKEHPDLARSILDRTEEDVPAPEFCLPGRADLEQFFKEQVIDVVANSARYKALGVGFPGAVLLHGPPGSGKTFAVEHLADYLGWPVFHVRSDSVGSRYIHETSRKIGKLFDEAMAKAPSMVVVDEMESYLADRSAARVNLHHLEETGEFLRRIPEAGKRRVLVVGMTNKLEMIDPAIERRGRFDHVVEVGMPTADEVSALIDALLQGRPVAGSIDTERVVDTLAGRPLSDADFVVREACRLAAYARKDALDQESLEMALTKLPSVKT